MEVYLGALLAGIGATMTPCVLPLYPAFLAYLTGGTGGLAVAGTTVKAVPGQISPTLAALLVWVGVVTGMLAIGAVVAAIAVPLGQVNRAILPIADVMLIGLGILLLVGINPFARCLSHRHRPSAVAAR